ncbi:hypothetical protein EDB86DRAFT_1984068 [Lactarius hatsudake]|nr:hypothetical protein EDB86DRAFT_1984068 [Lactarius hatsudake]
MSEGYSTTSPALKIAHDLLPLSFPRGLKTLNGNYRTIGSYHIYSRLDFYTHHISTPLSIDNYPFQDAKMTRRHAFTIEVRDDCCGCPYLVATAENHYPPAGVIRFPAPDIPFIQYFIVRGAFVVTTRQSTRHEDRRDSPSERSVRTRRPEHLGDCAADGTNGQVSAFHGYLRISTMSSLNCPFLRNSERIRNLVLCASKADTLNPIRNFQSHNSSFTELTRDLSRANYSMCWKSFAPAAKLRTLCVLTYPSQPHSLYYSSRQGAGYRKD